jgi:hypothetical protein
MAKQYPQQMSRGLKLAVYATFGTLWAGGCIWLVLNYFFARATDFGAIQNPWAPLVLRFHGWIAVGSVFLLGWVTARHVSDRWPQMIKRASGLAIAGAATLLALTGYALYYTTDGLHDAAGAVHEAVGAVAVLFGLVHWRRVRPRGRGAREHLPG